MKQISSHAAVAKLIRAHLKSIGIKGTVRSESYSGGTSVRVHVSDLNPTAEKELSSFCGQFEYGHFDGMTDCYEYSNRRDDIPQVKFLFVQNTISVEMEKRLWDFCRANYSGMESAPVDVAHAGTFRNESWQAWGSELVYRTFNGTYGVDFWGDANKKAA